MAIKLTIEGFSSSGVGVTFTHFNVIKSEVESFSGRFTIYPTDSASIAEIKEMAETKCREILKTESESKMRFD